MNHKGLFYDGETKLNIFSAMFHCVSLDIYYSWQPMCLWATTVTRRLIGCVVRQLHGPKEMTLFGRERSLSYTSIYFIFSYFFISKHFGANQQVPTFCKHLYMIKEH